jgi:hypothetical protein
MTFAFDDEGAAMRAHIRKASELGFIIGRDDQRLVETSLEQRERKDVTGSFHASAVGRKLPAPRENVLLLEREVPGIGVNAGGEGRGGADIAVDIHSGKRKARHLSC